MSPAAASIRDGAVAYTLPQAAQVVPYSEKTLRRAALKPADDGIFPHPLEAKRDTNGRITVSRAALQRWHDQLPDA